MVWATGSVGLLVFVAACSSGGHNRSAPTTTVAPTATTAPAPPSTPTSAPVDPMQHFDATRKYGLSFDHPRRWREVHYDDTSTLSSAIIFLSNRPLHDPCVRSGGSTTCGYPATRLRPGMVVVTWFTTGALRRGPQIPHPNLTVSGQPARLDSTPTGACRRYGGQQTVTAHIRINRNNRFQMLACLRGPDVRRNEALVRQMLATVRVSASPARTP